MLLGKDGDGDEKICINPKCECRRKQKKRHRPVLQKERRRARNLHRPAHIRLLRIKREVSARGDRVAPVRNDRHAVHQASSSHARPRDRAGVRSSAGTYRARGRTQGAAGSGPGARGASTGRQGKCMYSPWRTCMTNMGACGEGARCAAACAHTRGSQAGGGAQRAFCMSVALSIPLQWDRRSRTVLRIQNTAWVAATRLDASAESGVRRYPLLRCGLSLGRHAVVLHVSEIRQGRIHIIGVNGNLFSLRICRAIAGSRRKR
ncbi:hypothetical protein C8J57DRAFT_1365935 [Mycena rebaudengoi]|nr:hypothetical protein C8J57DRAFT_1365935 [Mycena rebaudengoi]